MTRDDIIRMAYKVSDGVLSYDAEGRWILSEQEVIRLTALVAAAEREACAKVCEKMADNIYSNSHEDSQPMPHAVAKFCATAIRARGEP